MELADIVAGDCFGFVELDIGSPGLALQQVVARRDLWVHDGLILEQWSGNFTLKKQLALLGQSTLRLAAAQK